MAGRVISLATSEQTHAAAATAFLAQPSLAFGLEWIAHGHASTPKPATSHLCRTEARAGSGRHIKRFLVCVKGGT